MKRPTTHILMFSFLMLVAQDPELTCLGLYGKLSDQIAHSVIYC